MHWHYERPSGYEIRWQLAPGVGVTGREWASSIPAPSMLGWRVDTRRSLHSLQLPPNRPGKFVVEIKP